MGKWRSIIHVSIHTQKAQEPGTGTVLHGHQLQSPTSQPVSLIDGKWLKLEDELI